MTNHYELLYIVSIKHTGDDLTKVIESVSGLLKTKGCTITHDDMLGKQKLAYPINKVHQGTYVVLEFDGPREAIKDLETELRLMKELLRFLVIKKRVKTAEDIAHEQRVQDRLLKEKQDELASMDSTSTPAAVAAAEPQATDKTASVAPESTAVVEVEEPIIMTDPASEPVAEPAKPEPVAAPEVVVETPVAPVKPAAPEVEVKERKDKNKVSLEDLDKKLDEILTDDIL
ncbi:TPA: 30S ribosomal protein S6 [Candidatus Falkowbacteria bacterium]|nr:30S ribosomal protein S6 [Candidatus Falkowbacteria bacterium]